jgi:plastocyanin
MRRNVATSYLFHLFVISILVLILIAVSCGGSAVPTSSASTETTPATTPPQPSLFEVFITPEGFVPAIIAIPAGNTVTWINKDTTWRAVGEMAPEGESVGDHPFGESGRIQPGEFYRRTFELPGNWYYYSPDTYQSGEVIIEEIE